MDAVYLAWFDNSTVRVDNQLADDGAFFTSDEIIDLTGAPAHSDIRVASVAGSIEFRIANPLFDSDMVRRLVNIADESFAFVLANDALEMKPQFSGKGIGTRCVIRELLTARAYYDDCLLRSVEVSAVGNAASARWLRNPLRGYYVWATMGFDAAIPASIRSRLSAQFQQCTRISELMHSDQGRLEWAEHGDSMHLSFDLHPASPCWSILWKYMKAKGIEP